jgi:hypothetical protein
MRKRLYDLHFPRYVTRGSLLVLPTKATVIVNQCSEAVPYLRHEQVISDAGFAGWSKLDFAVRDKCRPLLPRLPLARNLWDRMEGAWLPPLDP